MDILELMNVPYYKKGKNIKIKKKNRGKFTEYCGGKVTQECIDKAKKSKNPTLRKRAVFAENAKVWKHQDGGSLESSSTLSQKWNRLVNTVKRKLAKGIQYIRNFFTSKKSHLKYVPKMNEGDSYNDSIVIDKGRQHMYVYDKKGNMVFNTPVSTGAYMGAKEKEGDSKTPVGKYSISSYTNKAQASKFGTKDFWALSYGSGIGMHGDAGHPENIGLPDSHGCIRMPNDSIPSFKAKAKPGNGTQVYILDEFGRYK